MNEGLQGFTFYRSYYDAGRALPPKARAEFLDAICAYIFDGRDLPDEAQAAVRYIWPLVKVQLDISIRRGQNHKSKQNQIRIKTESNQNQIKSNREQGQGKGQGQGQYTPISPQAGTEADSVSPDEIQTVAARLAEAHPRRGGVDSVRRAIASAVKKNGRAALAAIAESHAAWCRCAEWEREGGRFAPKLTTWISGGAWKVSPPDCKKNAAPDCADVVHDCSVETC